MKVIAVANPKLAPYGAAAVETLQKTGIWDQVMAKIVYAENISMAKQYGTSKNADAVFTAYSLVLKEAGKVIPVDEALHTAHRSEAGNRSALTTHRRRSKIHSVRAQRSGPRYFGALRIQSTLIQNTLIQIMIKVR